MNQQNTPNTNSQNYADSRVVKTIRGLKKSSAQTKSRKFSHEMRPTPAAQKNQNRVRRKDSSKSIKTSHDSSTIEVNLNEILHKKQDPRPFSSSTSVSQNSKMLFQEAKTPIRKFSGTTTHHKLFTNAHLLRPYEYHKKESISQVIEIREPLRTKALDIITGSNQIQKYLNSEGVSVFRIIEDLFNDKLFIFKLMKFVDCNGANKLLQERFLLSRIQDKIKEINLNDELDCQIKELQKAFYKRKEHLKGLCSQP